MEKNLFIPSISDFVTCPSGLVAVVKPFDGESQQLITSKAKTRVDKFTKLAQLVLVEYGGKVLSQLTDKEAAKIWQMMPPADRAAILVQARYLSLFNSEEDLKDDFVEYAYKEGNSQKRISIKLEGFEMQPLQNPCSDFDEYCENEALIEFAVGGEFFQIERARLAHIEKLSKIPNIEEGLSLISLLSVRNLKKRNATGEWVSYNAMNAPLKVLKGIRKALAPLELEFDTTYQTNEGLIDILTQTDFFLAI